MEPRTVAAQHDGLRIAALDWGGDGPPLLLLHPNGFCAGLFDPLARRLREQYRVVGVDLRGHGGSDPPATRDDYGYPRVAGDALAVIDAFGFEEVVAVGESLGGAAAILLDELRPGVVRKMLLCEAIAFSFDPALGPVPSSATALDDGGNFMSATARRRRRVWPDRPAVLASYARRPPLDVLEPDALAGYVRWGFRDRPDGEIELACDPEVEATFYEIGGSPDGALRAFAHLPSLSVPATVVCADGSNLGVARFEQQAKAAGAPLVVLPGSHLFLQEDSARAEALVLEHLTW